MSIITTYKRLLNWEHWSVYFFYIPILPYAFYESFKSRHLCFFYSTNPGIYHSGSGVESKYKTLNIIPIEYRPKTVLIPKNSSIDFVSNTIKEANLKFPLMAKPDVGFRGYLVKLLNNKEQLDSYNSKFSEIDFIIQEYISYNHECGIFYTKKPSETKGNISSVTLKKFPTVKGDGKSTLQELINGNDRALYYFDQYKNLLTIRLDEVLDEDIEYQLSVIGNHSKGTQFLNGNHLIDDQLKSSIDRICKNIKGFNYGRLDIKYDSVENLKNGINIKILEVNGIIAEPTHVFDRSTNKSSYWDILKEQIKHWSILSDIAREQHTINNVSYHPFSDFIKDLFWLKKYIKKLKELNKS